MNEALVWREAGKDGGLGQSVVRFMAVVAAVIAAGWLYLFVAQGYAAALPGALIAALCTAFLARIHHDIWGIWPSAVLRRVLYGLPVTACVLIAVLAARSALQ